MDPDPSSLTLLLLSLLASAFFSGMEIAYVSANRLQAELDRNSGGITGRIVDHLLRRPERFIASMLVGNNLAVVIFGLESGRLLGTLLFGVPEWESAASPLAALAVQTAIATLVVLVTAEFLPKSFFHGAPNRWLRVFSLPLFLLHYMLLAPASVVLALSRIFLGRKPDAEREEQLGAVDLDHYVRGLNERLDPEDEAELDNELQILQNALDFSNLKARDCLVPRNEIIAVEVDSSLTELERCFSDTGLSKVVVFRGDIDHIVGYVHSKDVLRRAFLPSQDGQGSSGADIASFLHPTIIVPEPMGVQDILAEFIRRRRHLAVVVDEYGGTSGILTMEDIVEELIGDIEDEHDQDALVEMELGPGHYRFSARCEVDDLNARFGLTLPESDAYETLGGLVLSLTEEIPSAGHRLELEGMVLTVNRVDGARIVLVEVLHSDHESA
ncbi:MAG: HlyC/CorC family transporter [Crocinitomicaceae bacterium TMED114]|nr:MAG: HlyC/CorC family transporter [Crocinitomicaceae bacterium TMED114]